MHSVIQDLLYGVRVLSKSWGISLAVIVALALGIGSNAAIFSVVDALLLHSLRYQDPSSLAVIWEQDAQGVLHNASAANFLDWRKQAQSFAEIAGWAPIAVVLTGLDHPERITGAEVTANFFRTLGARPMLGRTFLPDEDGLENPANAGKTAIVSYSMWRDVFASDPNILGRTIALSNVPYVVAGVMPEDFVFRLRLHSVWVPVQLDRTNRDYRYLTSVGRLRTPLAAAGAEMRALEQNLASSYPKSNRGWNVQLQDLQEWLIVNPTFRNRLLILFAGVALVLLIACANVASLLLARCAARSREIALRLALGATRVRVARQLLSESLLLAGVSGVAALALVWLLVRSAPSLLPPNLIPPGTSVAVNGYVIAFSVGLTLFTGVLFGVAPALFATRQNLQEVLQDSTRGSTGGAGSRRFLQWLVGGEVALALIVLAVAAVMTESFRRLSSIDLGFTPDRVYTLRLVLPTTRYNDTQAWQLQQQLVARAARTPGVEHAALASNLPLARVSMSVPFDLDSTPVREESERPGVGYISVTPGYVQTLNIPLKLGRAFTDTDRADAPAVAMINEAFAAKHFGGQNPVGQVLRVNRPILGQKVFTRDIRTEIVGVVANVSLSELGAPPEPILYVPQAQNVWSPTAQLIVRSAAGASAIQSAIHKHLSDLDRDQPVEPLGSMEETFSNQFAQPRFQSWLMGGLGVLALVLAMIGIYGVNAYTIARERREIGIRLALGAEPGAVVRQTIRRGITPALLGIVVGVIGANFAAPMLGSVIVGIGSADPVVLALVALVLLLVAALACYLPARQAAQVDPAEILRQD